MAGLVTLEICHELPAGTKELHLKLIAEELQTSELDINIVSSLDVINIQSQKN